MTGSLADYGESKTLDHVNGRSALAMPTPRVALFTADPGEAGPGAEVAGGTYARQNLVVSAPTGTSPTSQTNSADVVFPVANANWGLITHFAIFDAAGGGNMLWHGALDTARNVLNGDQLKFAAGQLTFTLD